MGLRDTLQTKLAAAFAGTLSDAVTSFTGIHTEKGKYDPVTETNTGGKNG